MKTNKSDYKFSLVQHLVFLYRVPVDIDQLKLIMLLVGTPGPELLMKISSESVSSQRYARFFSNRFSAPNLPLCCTITWCVCYLTDSMSSTLLALWV